MGLAHNNVITFNRALTTFAREVGYTIEYAALREAALMCRDAITFTPPFAQGGGGGETKQAELQGKRAVERDLNDLFVAKNSPKRVAGGMLINDIAAAARNRDFSSFALAMKAAKDQSLNFDSVIVNAITRDDDILRAYKKAQNFFNKTDLRRGVGVVDDLGPIHKRYKYTSRQGKTKIIRHQGNYLGKFLVKSQSELNRYIKSQQEMVGKLKSGWWNVMQTLPKPQKNGVDKTFGRKGVAGYVKKFPGNNFHSIYKTEKAVMLRFGNMIGNAGEKATKNNVLGLVYNTAILRMERDTEQLLKRDAGAFNSGRIR